MQAPLPSPIKGADPAPAAIASEQSAALRAGLALLAMVDTVPLDLAVNAHRPYDHTAARLDVTIGIESDSRRDSERDPERVAGFRTLAETLALTVTAHESDFRGAPRMTVVADTTITGVPVRFWLYLAHPDAITAARQAFPTPAVAA